MNQRAPVILAVIRRRRPGAPAEIVAPEPTPTVRRLPPPTFQRWPEPGAIEQIFREAKRLRP
jgi:hypothetical protein